MVKKMKKNTILRKKVLLLPKILSNIVGVGGINTNLHCHKTKEDTMVTEGSKSYRYDKLEEALVLKVHTIADAYKEKIKENKPENELDQEAYSYACNTLMERIGSAFGQGDTFWIYEIILEEYFDYEPSARNPYALRKPRKDFNEEHLSNPYKLIVANFR